jgi:diguanylate cyclase (GGDEF)-like protein
LNQFAIAMLAWAVAIFITVTAWVLGLLETNAIEMGILVLIVLGSLLFFHISLRTGWSRRFRDPSMTLAHILVAILVALWVVSKAQEARPVLLMLFILAAMFSTLRLRQRESMIVALVAVAGYTALVVGEIALDLDERRTPLVALELAAFGALMLWTAWFGSYVSRLRRTLSQRNRELQDASERLRHLADHDDLTGLPNRRRLITQLGAAAESAHEVRPLSIAILDLDHFKNINDTHGHQIGDEVLREFSRRASMIIRGADELVRVDDTLADIGRFGGEEFMAILPDTDRQGATLAAERLRKGVTSQPFATRRGHVRCGVSIGVTSYRPGEPVHKTVARADQALYEAKDGGRNRVVAR